MLKFSLEIHQTKKMPIHTGNTLHCIIKLATFYEKHYKTFSFGWLHCYRKYLIKLEKLSEFQLLTRLFIYTRALQCTGRNMIWLWNREPKRRFLFNCQKFCRHRAVSFVLIQILIHDCCPSFFIAQLRKKVVPNPS